MGYLRNTNDPILTFEGDNNVLNQQTSNYLLNAYDEFVKSKSVPDTPLETVGFLKRFDSIMSFKFMLSNRNELLDQNGKFCLIKHS